MISQTIIDDLLKNKYNFLFLSLSKNDSQYDNSFSLNLLYDVVPELKKIEHFPFSSDTCLTIILNPNIDNSYYELNEYKNGSITYKTIVVKSYYYRDYTFTMYKTYDYNNVSIIKSILETHHINHLTHWRTDINTLDTKSFSDFYQKCNDMIMSNDIHLSCAVCIVKGLEQIAATDMDSEAEAIEQYRKSHPNPESFVIDKSLKITQLQQMIPISANIKNIREDEITKDIKNLLGKYTVDVFSIYSDMYGRDSVKNIQNLDLTKLKYRINVFMNSFEEDYEPKNLLQTYVPDWKEWINKEITKVPNDIDVFWNNVINNKFIKYIINNLKLLQQ